MTTEPIGFARDLPAQRVMRATIGDTDMVVWRSKSGKLAAWGNRCPHRGMRLSHGFVRGESLACLYHGWHYGRSGVCTYIPAHPDLDPPKSIKAETYQIKEQNGVLWAASQGDVQATRLKDGLSPVRSLTLDCGLSGARAAFLTTSFPSLPDGKVLTDNGLSFGDVMVLLQRNPDGTVTAHILACETWMPPKMIALSRWAEAVRRAAECRAESE